VSLGHRAHSARWLRPIIIAGAVGLGLLIAAGTAVAVSARGSHLNDLAARATIIGAGLAVAGAIASTTLFVFSRLAASVNPASAAQLLRRRVIEHESRVKAALLKGLLPADLGFTASGAPRRKAGPHGTSLSDQSANQLLHYQKDGYGDIRDGSLAEIGTYYRDLRESGVSRLLILGEPGSGKTVLAIELLLQLLQEEPEPAVASGASGKIPVRLNVASWTADTGLPEWLAGRLVADYAIPLAAAEELVADRRLLPVLDGLDEMDPDPAYGMRTPCPTAPRAAAFLEALNNYADVGRPGPVVLTCRKKAYDQLRQEGAALAAHQEITILNLDTAQIRDYLHSRYREPASPQRRNWNQVLKQLDSPQGAAPQLVLSTPWRLLLAITATEAGKDPGQLLAVGVGEDPQAAARRIDENLLAAYIPAATRLTARRSRSGIGRDRYDPDKVTGWMQNLALHLQWQGQQLIELRPASPVGMSGIDIVPHLLWPVGGVRRVRIIYAAVALSISTVAAVFMGYAFVGWPATWVAQMKIALSGGTPTLKQALYDVLPVLVVPFGVATAVRAWPRPASSSVRVPASRRLARGLGFGLAFGLAFWVLFGVTLELLTGTFSFAIEIGAVFGFGLGVAFGIAFGIRSGTWSPDANLASPYDGLRTDRRAGFATGLAVGLTFGLAVGLAFILGRAINHASPEITPDLVFGLCAGLAAGLFTLLWSPRASGRYAVGVVCAAIIRRFPLRLKDFMTWACDSGLLRTAGTAYQFRHRELQDWLTRECQHWPSYSRWTRDRPAWTRDWTTWTLIVAAPPWILLVSLSTDSNNGLLQSIFTVTFLATAVALIIKLVRWLRGLSRWSRKLFQSSQK
jgi:hypothetical protein